MPLCRKCIPNHESFHKANGTKPRLVLIKDCLSNAKKSLLNLNE